LQRREEVRVGNQVKNKERGAKIALGEARGGRTKRTKKRLGVRGWGGRRNLGGKKCQVEKAPLIH